MKTQKFITEWNKIVKKPYKIKTKHRFLKSVKNDFKEILLKAKMEQKNYVEIPGYETNSGYAENIFL